MPQPGELKQDDSLFSLELVVEKVYIPHTPCRFPAIAFRLLDYPTIVIKHVEDDLGKAIRSKISFDPYYTLPEQFTELKDRHGNFMVNKGKSCLLRIQVDTLKQHLANTPLYVMIIDVFPEVPKLIGNSSVPLNSTMNSICIDISKLGPTVPSVHGDKGLFKLYNLMGNEIGYFVLGFRLLYLGQSLIPHIPDSVLHQHFKIKEFKEDRQVQEIIQQRLEETNCLNDPEIKLRNSACMTDPVKHDINLQTMEMEDKAINVAEFVPDSQTEIRATYNKGSYSISTQTERRKKIKEAQNVQRKWGDFVGHQADDHDDIVINNIVCPPPLFYNSKALPNIKILKQNLCQEPNQIFVDDLSDIESYDGQGLEKVKIPKEENVQMEIAHQAAYFESEKEFISPELPIPQARVGEIVQGLQVAPNSGTVFPLLTALINELSCIQNPQLLLNVSNRMQAASHSMKKSGHSPENEVKFKNIEKNEKLPSSVVTAIASTLTKKLENSKDNKNVNNTEKPPKSHNFHHSVKPETTEKGNQQFQKHHFLLPTKKSKLVYRLTNTQRLRLQKTNPQWLHTVEKEVADLKIKKQAKKQNDIDDMTAAMFSDTLTEVRRLAEKELNNTSGGDTLHDIPVVSETGISAGLAAKQDASKTIQVKDRNADGNVNKSKQNETHRISSSHRSLQKIRPISSKSRTKPHTNQTSYQNEKVMGSSGSDEIIRRPVPQARHLRHLTSSLQSDLKLNTKNIEAQQPSPDLSSRSRSIEVCLPSPDLTGSDDDIPLPDDSLTEKREPRSINFPKYLARDISLPESIDGAANESLNVSLTLDDNSPLESTRHSKNFTSDKNHSKQLQSTDYDTHQFQSTDEPELQDLLSQEENKSEDDDSGRRSAASMRASQKFPVINPQQSENSPVPSVRRSTNKLDPTAHNYIPSFSQRIDPSTSSKSVTSKLSMSNTNDFKLSQKEDIYQPLGPIDNDLPIPKINSALRSSSSPRHFTSQNQKPLLGSLHTDSLSSYMPSDPDNVIVSLSSHSGMYSDDFQLQDIGESEEPNSPVEELPKFIPSSKLGYTIH